MGHHHVHPYLLQIQALFVAASIPIAVLLVVAGARWETHKRRHGRTHRPGSRRSIVAARFLPAVD
jgi:hypothetical protein